LIRGDNLWRRPTEVNEDTDKHFVRSTRQPKAPLIDVAPESNCKALMRASQDDRHEGRGNATPFHLEAGVRRERPLSEAVRAVHCPL